jgi:hypothetical protein
VAESEGNSFKIRLEAEVMDLARRQHGHVARWQLLGLGVSQGLIAGRLASCAWVAIHKGVYCIGPRRDDPVSRAAAAVLACGSGAVLSHASAASLWGFLPRWSFPLEVTAERRRERPGITAHRCPSLQPRDITRQRGVPATTPARTALDIAPRLSDKQLTRLVNNQRHDGNLRPAALQDIVQRNPRHPGARLLSPFAHDHSNPTDSPFEDDFKGFVARYGLPQPVYNFPYNGRRLDVFFPEHGVIVELDGWDYHRDRDAFESDRERDADHLDHGHVTIRITKERLENQPDYEAARLHRILSQEARRRVSGNGGGRAAGDGRASSALDA